MKTGILKSLALIALTAGALVIAVPGAAEARAILNLNTTNTQQCNGYTRTFIDDYGYQRSATGTACLQPNGEWVVVSETMDAFRPALQQPRVVYQQAPAYYVQPPYVYVNDRNWRRDYNYNRGYYNQGYYNQDRHGGWNRRDWDRNDDTRFGRYNR